MAPDRRWAAVQAVLLRAIFTGPVHPHKILYAGSVTRPDCDGYNAGLDGSQTRRRPHVPIV